MIWEQCMIIMTKKRGNLTFLVTTHYFLILWQLGVFYFAKVWVFLPMLFTKCFITTTYSYELSKTVLTLVKKNTLPRYDLFFLFSKCCNVYTGSSMEPRKHTFGCVFFIIELLLGIIYFVTLLTTISSTYFAMLEHLKARKLDIWNENTCFWVQSMLS